MMLKEVPAGKSAVIEKVTTGDRELDSFLLSLGCYSGEPIRVISHGRSGSVVAIKDGRYSVDNALARAIEVF